LAELEVTLDRIAQFIGVAPFTEMPTVEQLRATPQRLRAAPPSAGDVAALAEQFATDLAGYAEPTGLDVSAWPTARVLAGSRGLAGVSSPRRADHHPARWRARELAAGPRLHHLRQRDGGRRVRESNGCQP